MEELAATRAECARLAEANQRLREQLYLQSKPPSAPLRHIPVDSIAAVSPITQHSPTDAKVKLFRNLFRGREDVYAVRWIGRDGKPGYSPACQRDWRERDASGKPKRRLFPLSDQVIFDHLAACRT